MILAGGDAASHVTFTAASYQPSHLERQMMTANTLRPYSQADRERCLAIFDSNVPRFFAPDERELFATFLDRFKAAYRCCATLMALSSAAAAWLCGPMAARRSCVGGWFTPTGSAVDSAMT